MRVCFLFYGGTYAEIAKVMIASVRRHMPDAIVTQLTDLTTKQIPETDEVRRIDGKMYAHLHWKHLMTCPLPFIRMDYDMVIQGDLSHVLEGPHELAFNLHGDPKVTCTEYGKKYPIAASLYAAKTHEFAKVLREEHIKSGLDDWLGAAHTHNEVAKRFHVKHLDGRVYNYCPKDRDDKPGDVLVIHYKGLKKHWMLPEEMWARAKVDEMRIGKHVRQYAGGESFGT